MKLAEALVIRAEIQKRIQQLKVAIKENLKVQQGDKPDEDPNALMMEANQLIEENHRMMTNIQLTNTLVRLADGRIMVDALAEREQLLAQYNLINSIIEASKSERERYSLSEIKWVKVLNTAPLRQQTKELATKIRKLNLEIQATNWQVDLIQR